MKYYAYCLQCLGGGKQLTPPTTKKKAEMEAVSHMNVYGHKTTVMEMKKNPGSGPKYHSFVYGSLPQWVLDENIGEGDRIEFQQYAGMGMRGKEYRPAVGRVHLLGPSGPVVVLPGDRYGARPVVVTKETFIRVVSKRKAKGNPRMRTKESRDLNRKAAELRLEATETANARGHTLVAWRGDARRQTSHCHWCKMEVQIDTMPPANGIEISGEAVALNCTHSGGWPMTADVRRAFGGKLPRGFKSNPMSRKDFEYMAALIADQQLQGAPVNVLAALTDFAVQLGMKGNPRFDRDRFARRILQLVSEGTPFRYIKNRARKNPLAIYGANPKGVRTVAELGRVIEIRYKRKDDGGLYKHGFKTRPRLLALSDGTIAVRP